MTTDPRKLEGEDLAAVTGGNAVRPGDPRTVGGSGNDTMLGIPQTNDMMAGRGGNDDMWGGFNNDQMTGGTGDDTMGGGIGRDTMAGDAGNDIVDGWEDDDTLVWAPGDGNDQLNGGSGTDTLRLEVTGLNAAQLLASFTPDAGSPMPQLVDGVMDLSGVSGSFAIGTETIHVTGFERLELAESRMSLWR
jgi:hypothetical protein